MERSTYLSLFLETLRERSSIKLFGRAFQNLAALKKKLFFCNSLVLGNAIFYVGLDGTLYTLSLVSSLNRFSIYAGEIPFNILNNIIAFSFMSSFFFLLISANLVRLRLFFILFLNIKHS